MSELEDDMDEVWRRVQASLPKGYAVMLRGSDDWADRGPTWKADAYHWDGRRKAWHVESDTANGALAALVVAMNRRTA